MRWNFWQRKKRESDLEEEIAFDLAAETEERVRTGIPRDEAARESVRQFGNLTLQKERTREVWAWAPWQRLGQDIRYGWRTLLKNPLFTSMAVLSLALGIGANTAIYSVMDAIMLRAPPVQSAEELAILN